MKVRGFLLQLLPLIIILSSVLLSGCSPDYAAMAAQRLEVARKNSGDIEIVAIQDMEKTGFINGVMLAADEINQRPEKLLGRSIKVNIEPDAKTFQEVKPTVRRIAANPRITAVLGHRKSGIATPASVIYEKSQIIFMPPIATSKELTDHDFQYLFRMIPNNEVMSGQLVSVAKSLGYKKIAMLYTRDDLSRELAFLFEESSVKQNIELVQSSSFFEDEEDYRSVISQFSDKTFDAFFIAASDKPAGKMVRQLREMGMNQPVIGRHSLRSTNYIKLAGKAAENTIVPTVLPMDNHNPLAKTFIAHFKTKYEAEPDYEAAQGYDSVMLLANVIQQAGSTVPSLLSSTMHYMPAWEGVTGLHAFDNHGELRGKVYLFEAWQEGQWHSLPAIQVPFLVQRFEQGIREKYGPSHLLTNFSEVFAEPLHDEEHNIYLLDLAQEILQFKRIGIIYENTSDGREIAGYNLLKALTARKDLKMVSCEVTFSALSKAATEKAVIGCYGKLALTADAMLVSPYPNVDPALIRNLNKNLELFKIPAISVDSRNNNLGASLILDNRSDINLRGIGGMQVYSGLLNNLKVHEFAERMKGLPEITINLLGMQAYGLSDKPILDLSPDNYIYPDSGGQP